MTEQSVTLQPGESEVVSFEATPTEARAYQVSVDGLTGSFEATEVRYLVPCVYCRATFSTEAGLISHMESSHPGQPYLIYAYGVRRCLYSSGGQGFIKGTGTVRAKYNPAPYDVRNIPRGTYPLVSGLGAFHNSGHGPTDRYWWKVDTGQILTVV